VDNNNSLVSICIPTYNSARYLTQCLDSIASQTYQNVEVIISDNASTDDTVAIIGGYVNRYGYKLHVNETNKGAAANFNKLIGLAKGEYVAIYHADDVYESAIVAESVKALNSDASIGVVGTMGYVINADGKYLQEFILDKEIKRLNKHSYNFNEAFRGMLKRRLFFITPSIMVRKKAYSELGVFKPEKYRSCCDYEMWLRIARKYNVAILNKKLIHYRVHENQGTELEIRKNIEIPDYLGVVMEYRQFITDEKIRMFCDNVIDRKLFRVAKKQNYYGYYDKSNETLNIIRPDRYRILKLILRKLNKMKISIKKRTLIAQ
jgi:glycosyltransferase involved in cell wall biosynthesis